jgi:hypothetical protein
MFFIREKRNYRIVINGSKHKIICPVIQSPFGIESYGNKQILNIEIDIENADLNDFYKNITNLDTNFQNINSIQNANIDVVKQDINKKQFISCIRNSKKGFIVRTHIKTGAIYHSEDGKQFYTSKELKNKKLKPIIELGPLWITDDSYGYILYITDIIVF